MKCLLCSQELASEEQLKEQYIDFHNVDPFKKYFKPVNQIYKPRKCLCCQEFILHDYFKHQEDSEFNTFEEKPIDIVLRRIITSYKISAQKYKDYYDFANPEELIVDFLKNIRSKFTPENHVVIKCGFSIENYQPAPIENDSHIINAQYWST